MRASKTTEALKRPLDHVVLDFLYGLARVLGMERLDALVRKYASTVDAPRSCSFMACFLVIFPLVTSCAILRRAAPLRRVRDLPATARRERFRRSVRWTAKRAAARAFACCRRATALAAGMTRLKTVRNV